MSSAKQYDYLSIIIYLFLLIIGIGAALHSTTFPTFNLANDVGTARFPLIFSISLSVLCGIGLIRTIFIKNQSTHNYLTGLKKAFIAIGLNTITILLIDLIGFYLATFIFSVSIMILLGIKNKYHIILLNLLLILFVYLIFQQLLNVPLPMGQFLEG
ncbi:tripartite tricarboxylate transporter TctB family protein [Volucribacter amazonae]|uniref:DUF1468 domain-containing protein n=1 Tax=Volucribacter amazonae TaxID=256731 RepID=A0A9X4PF32_9PAST|nr:tripartite tricarboxylate transporter TctB family protein [Volucribacter amazonae]MDG6896089.1 hypothetical protein [Volucribacter amazonae]